MKGNLVTAAVACLIGNAFARVLDVGGKARCANPDPSQEELQALQDTLLAQRQNSLLPRQSNSTISVPVYFHVASTTANANRITDEAVQKQFAVLRDAYARYAVQLNLISTERVVDDLIGTGFYGPDGSIGDNNWDAYIAYLRSARKGGYEALNVYFYSDLVSGISGICNLPTVVSPDSEFFYRDGCQINGDSMPGVVPGSIARGHTAIHEVGHWFGLLHTFQGGCSDFGDGVLDTPAQQSPTSGCPASRDSCPNNAGEDPIHNYMDYSDDTCTNEFTPGQQERIHNMYQSYRGSA